MADQSERPERIWLLHGIGDEGSDVWCDDPAPNHPTLDQPDSTEYVRADALDACNAEIARLREALETCRQHANEGCNAPNAADRWCERIDEVAHAALIRQAMEGDDG